MFGILWLSFVTKVNKWWCGPWPAGSSLESLTTIVVMGSFTINKEKHEGSFVLTNRNRNEKLRLPKLQKQTETKSFIYKTNINKQKRRASFTKPTETNRNKQLHLQNQQKPTETNCCAYLTNINKHKQTATFKN